MSGRIDVKVRNTTVSVTVDDSGEFTCMYLERHYREKQLDTLRGKLLAASRKATVRVNVLFVEKAWDHNGPVLKRGTATGLHGSSGNMLIQWEGKKGTEQERSYRSTENRLRVLSKDEEKTYLKLLKDAEAAKEAVRKFEEAREISVRAEVEKLIQAEIEKQEPAAEPAEKAQ